MKGRPVLQRNPSRIHKGPRSLIGVCRTYSVFTLETSRPCQKRQLLDSCCKTVKNAVLHVIREFTYASQAVFTYLIAFRLYSPPAKEKKINSRVASPVSMFKQSLPRPHAHPACVTLCYGGTKAKRQCTQCPLLSSCILCTASPQKNEAV